MPEESQSEGDEIEIMIPGKSFFLQFPSMNLLKFIAQATKVDMNEQNENKEKIIHSLRNYGIEIISIKATVGPITLLSCSTGWSHFQN